jgi:hypothetical protein
MASRDRLKLDERWNFARQTAAAAFSPTAKVPAKETSAGPAVKDSRNWKTPGQLPDKLKTCRHKETSAGPAVAEGDG